ncbi:hypothetical protein Emed_006849 [Eimeria media]
MLKEKAFLPSRRADHNVIGLDCFQESLFPSAATAAAATARVPAVSTAASDGPILSRLFSRVWKDSSWRMHNERLRGALPQLPSAGRQGPNSRCPTSHEPLTFNNSSSNSSKGSSSSSSRSSQHGVPVFVEPPVQLQLLPFPALRAVVGLLGATMWRRGATRSPRLSNGCPYNEHLQQQQQQQQHQELLQLLWLLLFPS